MGPFYWQQKFNFLRVFNDWEMNQIANLLCTLQKVKVNTEPDSISAREAYSLLSPRTDSVFPAKGVWISNPPPKSVFFTWEAVWGECFDSGQA